jgi:tRNA A-37 threonylcarbamoyl transferase component Bud32
MAERPSRVVPAPTTGVHRRRRPVGEPPPLPRNLHGFAFLWIGVVVLLALVYWWGRTSGAAGTFQRSVDRIVTEHVPDLSGSWRNGAEKVFPHGIGWWALIVVRWTLIVLFVAWKRWRHLAVFAGSAALVAVVSRWFPTAGQLGTGMQGHPSYAAAALAVTLVSIVYGLVPRGRWRARALIASAVMCVGLAALFVLIRQDSPSEIAIGFGIGFAIPFLAFRVFVPESVFPVTYRRGRSAHLDLGGLRKEAIEVALREQLGIDAAALEPFGQAGSGGSTPLRITLADGRHLFAKLYAGVHVRADRWYKLGRTVLYGALEDERSFNSVRRMVEYEDYMLRYLRDNGVPTAEPYGIAEITPEREYLLVTDFIEDATEILARPIDDEVMASAIGIIRSLWEAGVAHRDIKPANLLVRDGAVHLIDAAFCQVRPSAWRQSVDLANMMLILALGSETGRVYDSVLRRFTPDEVAEAFAATRGVTVPSQLRALVMRDERSLAKEFSLLAPSRRRIPVQRWTLRRVALTGALLAGAAISIVTSLQNLHSAGFSP